jgi:hypothetical protein
LVKRYLIFSWLIWLAIGVTAQSEFIKVNGSVLDADDGQSVIGATVLLINVKDSLRSGFAVADGDGRFSIDKLESAFYRIRISSVGYLPFTTMKRLNLSMDLGVFALKADITELDAVKVSGEVVPMEIKGDTIQYNAAAFKTNPDATTADLVSKMPGIVVDKSGVTANGEQVKQVLLDGKRFFGTDPLLSLNNIPAEIVDNLQIYDEQSDQARFTGFDDGNTTKTMNVVTKKNRRNGQFGRVYAGFGSDDRYSAGGVLNSFNGNSRFTILGMTNNINLQNFSNEDLAGIGGGTSRRGQGSRGGGDAALNANQDGITTTNTIGFNYSDQWGKRTTIESNYFFNNTNNQNLEHIFRTSNIRGEQQLYSEKSNSSTLNNNHRFNLRLNYKLSDDAQLLFRSALSTQNNTLDELTQANTSNAANEQIGATDNSFKSENTASSLSNTITYQQKLNDLGRTFSISVDNSMRPIDRQTIFKDINADSTLDTSTEELINSYGGRFNFTEPVGTFGQLEAEYRYDYNGRSSNKLAYAIEALNNDQVLIKGLSSDFESGYITHVPTLSYSNRNYESLFRLSLSYQHAALSSTQAFPEPYDLKVNFNSALISMMRRMPVGTNGNLFLRYQTSTDEPSVNQLQGVVEYNNPLFLSVGNPSLNQAYSHNLMARYSSGNPDKNITFANFTSLSQTNNYIANATYVFEKDSVLAGSVTAVKGAQLSKPENLSGYWNIRNSTTFGKLVSPLKSNINTTLGVSYTRLPGAINNETNYSNNYSGSLRLSLASNISEKIDFNLYAGTSANLVHTSLSTQTDSRFMTNTVSGKFNFIFWKDIVFRGNLAYLQYRGVDDSADQDYTLLNLSLAKKLFENKLGELELTVFDLLGQNTSISQQVTNVFVQETTTSVIQRYFMLTFSYQLRRFK